MPSPYRLEPLPPQPGRCLPTETGHMARPDLRLRGPPCVNGAEAVHRVPRAGGAGHGDGIGGRGQVGLPGTAACPSLTHHIRTWGL